MAISYSNSLHAWVGVIQPVLEDLKKDTASSIKDFAIQVGFADDDLELIVRHKLFDRIEILNGGSVSRIAAIFRERVHQILQIKSKTPKQLTVERRRMLWRGHCAVKAKAKKR